MDSCQQSLAMTALALLLLFSASDGFAQTTRCQTIDDITTCTTDTPAPAPKINWGLLTRPSVVIPPIPYRPRSDPAPSGRLPVTGADLVSLCDSSAAEIDQIVCRAYIVGAVKGATDYGEGLGHKDICAPANISSRETRDTVLSFLRERPELETYSAASLAILALENTFRCAPTPTTGNK